MSKYTPMTAQQQDPVAGEPLTDSQIMASIGRHWGGEKTSISQSRPVGQQWEQICELVRCVIRERYTSPQPAQQQEPVGEIGKIVMFGGDLKEVSWKNGKMPPVGSVLYTSPPASKPLTDEQIAHATAPIFMGGAPSLTGIARAIEAAHGIKEDA